MPQILRTALLSAALLAPLAARAWSPTPSAFDITGPGGLASACAAVSSVGAAGAPHEAISGYLYDDPANVCGAQVFSGAGSATAPTQVAASVQAVAQSSAGLGWVKVEASLDRDFGVGFFPTAKAGGGWADQLTIHSPGLTGQSGHLLAQLHVSGSLHASAGGGAVFDLIALRNKAGMGPGGLGFDPGSATANGSQWLSWSLAGWQPGPKTIDEVVTLTVPFVFGQSFELGVWGRAIAATGNHVSAGASLSDFGQTLTWAGVGGVVVNDQILTGGFTLSSASGTDWMQPVPEPGSWALMLGGLLGLGTLARRRLKG